jgi:hypothetical protein
MLVWGGPPPPPYHPLSARHTYLWGSVAEVALDSQSNICSALCAICSDGRLNPVAYLMRDGEGEVAHPPQRHPFINHFPRLIQNPLVSRVLP